MSKEQVFSHNQAKSVFNGVLWVLVTAGKLGRYFMDGLRLIVAADLSAVPDGTFISKETMREASIQLIERREGRLH